MISQRTSAGLQAAKAKGVKLGNQQVADANRAAAKERAERCGLFSTSWTVCRPTPSPGR